jgi:NTP pyrophosphatase (non-canonical NTP hydrolase)
MSSVNAEELVEVFMAIRSQREAILREYEAKDAALKSDIAKIEAALLEVCNSINANSINTKHGTVMRKLNERFFCQDWDNFYKFVLDNEAPQLLERRISQGNFKEYMTNHSDDGLPPGINVMREYGVSVRKASK